jgi:hypothetical protein
MVPWSAVRSAAHSGWTALRGARPLAILAIGFAVFVAYGFPGFMSSDPVLQLHEARTAVFSNAHPPAMAAEWRVLEVFVTGPILMLVLQGALFLGGLYRILCHRLAPRPAAVAAVCVLLFPPVLTPMAVIWKDSQMAAYLVAGIAALLSPRLGIRLIGLALVAAACAFRYNAAAAALPIVGLLFVWRPGQRWWIRTSIAALAFVAVVAAAFKVNALLTVETRFLSPAYTDIVGVLYYEDHRSDEDLRELLRGTPLLHTTDIHARARALYSPRTSWQVTRGEDRLFEDPKSPEQAAALNRAWKELVLGDPEAYLAHRTAVFAELLGLSDAPLWGPVFIGFAESAEQATWIQHEAVPSRLQSYAARALGYLASETMLFRPYLYAAIAILLLALCCRDRLTLALLLSGLAYEAGYFPIGSTPDTRYSHWMTLCTCVAALLLFVQRYRAGRGAA